ncbi:proprotein convertase P-domain-containing protein [Beijerinckia indica]|uniref:Proprotein convertase P n=1 Tax=Beijerinckia indica subsp. indica (strain ATCC 9039 / DSM 1715 / NCIMB 8712) TaxID=395963 RepID=B2IL47_BEII9|nr:proprotein convertase P-domain-containing protein [Beijerinckia indica]ACB97247.1 Proprotein convertase P [Beijerinckia indica subsp. indica ATCC 9039]
MLDATTLAQLQNIANAQTNVGVKNAVVNIINLATGSNPASSTLAQTVNTLLGGPNGPMSAKANGSALFYSDDDNNPGKPNLQAAKDCQTSLKGNGYFLADTQAGVAAEKLANQADALSGAVNTSPAGDAIMGLASAMMGAQADNAYAFVSNAYSGSIWTQYELPALLGQTGSEVGTVNGLNLSNYNNYSPSQIQNLISASQACDPNNLPPPTGGVPANDNLSTTQMIALGLLGAATTVGVGALIILGAPVEIPALGVGGIMLLLTTSQAAAKPIAPTTTDAASQYQFQWQLNTYNGAQIAPALGYILAQAQGAPNVSSLAMQVQPSLVSLRNLVTQSNSPLFAQTTDSSGNLVNVTIQSNSSNSLLIQLASATATTAVNPATIDVGFNNSGGTSFEQTTVTNANGSAAVLISGDDNNASINNSTISLNSGATATITGNSNTFALGSDSSVTLNSQGGSNTVTVTGDPWFSWLASQTTRFEADANGVRVGYPGGNLGTDYSLNDQGQITAAPVFMGFGLGGGYASDSAEAGSLQSSVSGTIPADTSSGPPLDAWLSSVVVINLGGGVGSGTLYTAPSGFIQGGRVLSSTDMAVIYPNANNDGVFNNSPSGNVAGYNRSANDQLSAPSQNLQDLVGGTVSALQTLSSVSPLFGAALADMASNASSWINTDPLVIGTTSAGITLTNWISNAVYFDTNVNPTTLQADGKLHHTSWVSGGTGIVALDRNGNGQIDDITETLSEFFQGGSNPGHYADGLDALKSLAQAGASVFSAATSLTDPTTHQSYWSELRVWLDANQNGVTDAGELKTLNDLGITSINLVGSGNLGESLEGSAVTNRTTYTKSDGSSGAVAAVDFATNTVGDIATSANGGITIQSVPEGGATPSNSFVIKNTSAHAYTLSNGQLIDNTTGQTVIASGTKGVFSTNQNDSIAVASSDPTPYWLGGGTGAATLTGGAGNTVFLINSKTIVHGGTGFNIAEVTDAKPITVDLKTANLQEVIGGAGDGVFNASGTNWNVFIQGGSGNNIIIGGTANDALAGGTGDDLIEAGTGGSVIHAGAGNDVIYGGSGSTSTAQPAYVNAGNTADISYVERLYEGGFGREASAGELQWCVSVLGNGSVDRVTLASYFLSNPEWQNRFGTQTDAQFVTSVFDNFLGRDPSAGELAQFTQALADGAPRSYALESVADNAQSQTYWGLHHPGASDVIYGGSGHDTIVLGTNNAVVYAGSGTMTVVGNANGFSTVGLHGSYADYTLTHNADGTITVTNIGHEDGDGTVTMKNVTALDFKDFIQVDIATALGMPVDDTLNTGNASQVTVNASGQYVISAITLLANDLDYAGKSLSIRELLDNNGNAIARGSSGQVNGGIAMLSTDGSSITFTPTPGFAGVMSFRYHVEDSDGQTGQSVVQTGTSNTAELAATVSLVTPSQPTDPLFAKEWFLQAADVIPLLKHYTGAGVSVGIFDGSGNVDFSNPDLSAHAGQSVKLDGTPGITQTGTHATLIAGVLGAAIDGEGAVGVAPDATLNSEAVGLVGMSTQTDANLMDWSNYDVVNNSFSVKPPFYNLGLSPAGSASELTAFLNAIQNGRQGYGTIIVMGGGNSRAQGENTNDSYLTSSPYAITVGGINATTDLSTLRISGAPFSDPGYSILISAPANNITSDGVAYTNAYGQNFGSTVKTAEGTSFATPIVSGVVADMLQANPYLSWKDVQQILAYSAVKVDPNDTNPFVAGSTAGSGWAFNGATNWNGGGLHYSPDYGFGEVDARAAVRLAQSWSSFGIYTDVFSHDTYVISTPLSSGPFSKTFTESSTTDTVETVQVRVKISNAIRSNLTITLISPSGVTSTLMARPGSVIGPIADAANFVPGAFDDFTPGTFDYTFMTQADRGEAFQGNWTVNISDAAGSTSQAIVTDVKIILQGNYTAGKPQTFIYTDEFATLSSTPGNALYDPNNAARFTLTGSGYQDTLNVSATTGAVNLDLVTGSTDSTIDGRYLAIAPGSKINKVYLGDGVSTVHLNADNDIINTGAGNAILYGGAGFDIYNIGKWLQRSIPAGNTTIYGGSGGSAVYIGDEAGSNILVGGAGVDTVSYSSASAGVTVNLGVTTAQATRSTGTDTLLGFENLTGSAYNDVLTGNGGNNVIDGGAGNDTIDGGPGNDTLIGGAGIDTVSYASATSGVTVSLALTTAQATGGAGTDTLSGFENLTGSAYNDVLTGDSGDNVIDGGAGNDLIDGGLGNDTLIGGAGIDTLTYASATSGVTVSLALTTAQATGGAGTDTLSGFENLTGSAYNDVLTGSGGDNVIDGGAGNDLIDGGLGNDTLIGGAGVDTVTYVSATSGVTVSLALTTAQATGGAGTDTLSGFENLTGSAYSDVLTGDGGDNVIDGGAGNDTLYGGAGNDTLIGGAGNDKLQGGAGDDTLDGGAGTDAASYTQALAGVTVSLAVSGPQNTIGAGTDTLLNIENLTGSIYDDVLTGDAGNNVIDGNAGNDLIDGGLGNDTLIGGSGTDTVSYASATSGVTVSLALTTAQNTGGAGTDTLSGFENLTGSAYNDVLTGDSGNNVIDGGLGNDTLDGGAGVDTVTYVSATSGVTVSLALTTAQATGGAGTDTLSGFENLTGSAYSDVLTGDGGDNVIDGGAGNDTLYGGAGNDTLIGGAGNDKLQGGAGDDTLDGGAGTDAASYTQALAGVTVSLAVSGPQNTIGAGTDTLLNIENLTGSIYDDVLTGDAGNNVIDGNAGNDLIDGGLGNDTLIGGTGIDTVTYTSATSGVTVSLALTTAQNTGGAGTDTLSGFENLTGSAYNDVLTGDAGNNVINGGAGNDILVGSAGSDTLDGGAGNDVYIYHQADGNMLIHDAGDSSGPTPFNTLSFADLTLSNLLFSQSGTDLVIGIAGTGHSITVQNELGASGLDGIQQINFADGSNMTHAQILAHA